MLEMNHRLASRGDYILTIGQSGLVQVLYGSNLSPSERAKRPGWLWGEAGRPRDHQRGNNNTPFQPPQRLDRVNKKPEKEVGDVIHPDHEEMGVA